MLVLSHVTMWRGSKLIRLKLRPGQTKIKTRSVFFFLPTVSPDDILVHMSLGGTCHMMEEYPCQNFPADDRKLVESKKYCNVQAYFLDALHISYGYITHSRCF